MRFRISHQAIDAQAFGRSLADPRCGAFVQFEGWVRNHNDGRDVVRLEYEVYEPLAVREGEIIIDEAIANVKPLRSVNDEDDILSKPLLTTIVVVAGALLAERLSGGGRRLAGEQVLQPGVGRDVDQHRRVAHGEGGQEEFLEGAGEAVVHGPDPQLLARLELTVDDIFAQAPIGSVGKR